MSDADNLRRLWRYRSDLEEGPDEEKLLEILSKLKRTVVTVYSLQETGIGKIVNRYRKKGGVVGAKAASVVAAWKSVVENEVHKPRSPSPVPSPENEEGSDAESEANSGRPDERLSDSEDDSNTSARGSPHRQVEKRHRVKGESDEEEEEEASPEKRVKEMHEEPYVPTVIKKQDDRSCSRDSTKSREYRPSKKDSSNMHRQHHDLNTSKYSSDKKVSQSKRESSHTMSASCKSNDQISSRYVPTIKTEKKVPDEEDLTDSDQEVVEEADGASKIEEYLKILEQGTKRDSSFEADRNRDNDHHSIKERKKHEGHRERGKSSDNDKSLSASSKEKSSHYRKGDSEEHKKSLSSSYRSSHTSSSHRSGGDKKESSSHKTSQSHRSHSTSSNNKERHSSSSSSKSAVPSSSHKEMKGGSSEHNKVYDTSKIEQYKDSGRSQMSSHTSSGSKSIGKVNRKKKNHNMSDSEEEIEDEKESRILSRSHPKSDSKTLQRDNHESEKKQSHRGASHSHRSKSRESTTRKSSASSSSSTTNRNNGDTFGPVRVKVKEERTDHDSRYGGKSHSKDSNRLSEVEEELYSPTLVNIKKEKMWEQHSRGAHYSPTPISKGNRTGRELMSPDTTSFGGYSPTQTMASTSSGQEACELEAEGEEVHHYRSTQVKKEPLSYQDSQEAPSHGYSPTPVKREPVEFAQRPVSTSIPVYEPTPIHKSKKYEEYSSPLNEDCESDVPHSPPHRHHIKSERHSADSRSQSPSDCPSPGYEESPGHWFKSGSRNQSSNPARRSASQSPPPATPPRIKQEASSPSRSDCPSEHEDGVSANESDGGSPPPISPKVKREKLSDSGASDRSSEEEDEAYSPSPMKKVKQEKIPPNTKYGNSDSNNSADERYSPMPLTAKIKEEPYAPTPKISSRTINCKTERKDKDPLSSQSGSKKYPSKDHKSSNSKSHHSSSGHGTTIHEKRASSSNSRHSSSSSKHKSRQRQSVSSSSERGRSASLLRSTSRSPVRDMSGTPEPQSSSSKAVSSSLQHKRLSSSARNSPASRSDASYVSSSSYPDYRHKHKSSSSSITYNEPRGSDRARKDYCSGSSKQDIYKPQKPAAKEKQDTSIDKSHKPSSSRTEKSHKPSNSDKHISSSSEKPHKSSSNKHGVSHNGDRSHKSSSSCKQETSQSHRSSSSSKHDHHVSNTKVHKPTSSKEAGSGQISSKSLKSHTSSTSKEHSKPSNISSSEKSRRSSDSSKSKSSQSSSSHVAKPVSHSDKSHSRSSSHSAPTSVKHSSSSNMKKKPRLIKEVVDDGLDLFSDTLEIKTSSPVPHPKSGSCSYSKSSRKSETPSPAPSVSPAPSPTPPPVSSSHNSKHKGKSLVKKGGQDDFTGGDAEGLFESDSDGEGGAWLKPSEVKPKHQPTPKLDEAEEAQMSFEDFMSMDSAALLNKGKSSGKSSSKKPSSSSSSLLGRSSLGQKSKSSYKYKLSTRDDFSVPAPSKNVKVTERDILGSLPETQAFYRPLPPRQLGDEFESERVLVDMEEIGVKKSIRSQIYSGKRHVITEVKPLFDLCMQILIENIDALDSVGGVPYSVLKPVLERCTAQQLYHLEDFNPHFLEDSDELWEKLCQRDFRGSQPDDMETWRELYLRRHSEREMKYQKLKQTMSSSIVKGQAGRKAQLAYVDSVAKPPREVLRKQLQYGTGCVRTNLTGRAKGLGPGGVKAYMPSPLAPAYNPMDDRPRVSRPMPPMLAKSIRMRMNMRR